MKLWWSINLFPPLCRGAVLPPHLPNLIDYIRLQILPRQVSGPLLFATWVGSDVCLLRERLSLNGHFE